MLKPLSLRPVSLKPVTLRPFGYNGSNTSWLIKNGILNPSVDFVCGTERVYGGVVFGVDKAIRDGRREVHAGSCTNKCLCDGVPVDRVDGVEDLTGSLVSVVYSGIVGHNVYRIENNTGSLRFPKVTGEVGNLLQHTAGIYARKGGGSVAVQVSGGSPADWSIPTDDFKLVVFEGFTPESATRQLEFYMSDGAWIEFYLPQLTQTKYKVLDIPSSADGPVSYDTAAASLIVDDFHGKTVDLNDPRNGWFRGWGDGERGTDVLQNVRFTGASIGGEITKTGDTYTLTSDGSGFTSVSRDNITEIGKRYDCILNVIETRGPSGVKVNNGAIDSFWGVSNTIGQTRKDREATTTNVTLGRQAAGQITDIDFTVALPELLPATGTLPYGPHTIVPTLEQWQTVGDKLVLFGTNNDEGSGFGRACYYVRKSDGKYCMEDKDGNVAVSPAVYVAKTPAMLELVLKGTTMLIRMDGVDGVEVPFCGTLFDGTDVIKIDCHEDLTYNGNIGPAR